MAVSCILRAMNVQNHSKYFITFCVLILSFSWHSEALSQKKTDTLIIDLEWVEKVITDETKTAQEVDETLGGSEGWNWYAISEYQYQFIQNLFIERAESSLTMEEKYNWYSYIRMHSQYFSRIGETVIYYEKMIAIANVLEDTLKINRTYFDLAYFYNKNNMLDESLEWMKASMQLTKPLEDQGHFRVAAFWYGFYLTNYAWLTKDHSLQDSAVYYISNAYNNLKRTNTYDGETIIIYTMALARADRREEAIKISKYGYRTATVQNDLAYMERFARQTADYYLGLGEKDSSIRYYQLAAIEDQKINGDNPQMVSLRNPKYKIHLHKIYGVLQYYDKFDMFEDLVHVMDQALTIAKTDSPELQMEYNHMAIEYYARAGETDKALQASRVYANLSDSLHRVEVNKYTEAHSAHAHAQISMTKEQAAKEKEALDLINEKENERQSTVFIALSSGIAGLGLFLGIVFNRFRKTQKQKKVIEEQKLMVDKSFKELETKNKEILSSIAYAKRIQSAILPPDEILAKHLSDAFVLYKPKDIVAGDFYWLEQKDDVTLFAAADCTGHGVPGAMVSVVCNNGLNRSVREHNITDPGAVLNKTRDIVIAEFEKSNDDVYDGMDIAVCALEEKTQDGSRKLKFAGAFNPLWIVRNGSGKVEEIKADKQPIGQYDFEHKPFTTHETVLNEGDTLYVFSDGYADQFGGPRAKKLRAQGLQKLFLEIVSLPMEEQRKRLNSFFEEWKGNLEQIDDICVMGVRI